MVQGSGYNKFKNFEGLENLQIFTLRTGLNTHCIRNLTKVFDLVKVHVAIHIIGFGIDRLELFQVLGHGGYPTE